MTATHCQFSVALLTHFAGEVVMRGGAAEACQDYQTSVLWALAEHVWLLPVGACVRVCCKFIAKVPGWTRSAAGTSSEQFTPFGIQYTVASLSCRCRCHSWIPLCENKTKTIYPLLRAVLSATICHMRSPFGIGWLRNALTEYLMETIRGSTLNISLARQLFVRCATFGIGWLRDALTESPMPFLWQF